jgi:O-antigen/teichoic acid export membrane protein
MLSIKHKLLSGTVWSSIESISVLGIQFVIQIVLARLLSPETFGVMAMLAVFLSFGQIFIENSLAIALVQKQDRTEVDYSTVFFFNVGVSIILFLTLFFSAPLIARFYKTPVLVMVTKVVSFNFLINLFGSVPKALLTIMIDFKSQTKASLMAVVISSIAGIWMAYSGYGIWALVFQNLLYNGVKALLLWVLSKWQPQMAFSVNSFKQLFSFGSKILFASLISMVLGNFYKMMIGKRFAAQELGYYSRADQFAQISSVTLIGSISRVVFPVMCKIQHDDEQLLNVFFGFLRVTTFIISPLMIGLAALSEPLIRLLLSEKWMGAVLPLQLLCLYYIWYPVYYINGIMLPVKGRSDLSLRAETLRLLAGLVIFFASFLFGITIIYAGLIVTSVICLYISTYFTKKYFNISQFQQMKNIMPSLFLSISMGCVIFLLKKTNLSDIVTIILSVSVGCLYYICIAVVFKMKAWKTLLDILSSYFGKKSVL